MSAPEPSGPDLSKGIAATDLAANSVLLGQVAGEGVLLVREGAELFALGANCTHYSSPLADGLVTEGTIRCPWHHAAFNLRTGEPIEGPAYMSLPCWQVEETGGRIVVKGKKAQVAAALNPGAQVPSSVVIIGAGAAGTSTAEELRRRGYAGPVTLIDADAETPVDRPNLSKDNLAGTAPAEWAWLHPDEFYVEQKITRRTGKVASIDRAGRAVVFDDGQRLEYDKLLIATGASAINLALTGNGPPVFTMRTMGDMKAIIAAVEGKKRAVVLGTSFIGLEVAASLRTRGLEVHVVGPDAVPLSRVLGSELGNVVRALHEKHGIIFHFEKKATGLTAKGIVLEDGSVVEGDVVVAGVGVRPNISLAEAAGLAIDKGILVDAKLKTNDASIFAAGDAARYPDALSKELLRIEHWAVAQNQGRTVARNMLGANESFREVPFFWSQHYDITIGYVGHAEKWDTLEIEGTPAELNCEVRYVRAGKVIAVATINRDKASLEAHAKLLRESRR